MQLFTQTIIALLLVNLAAELYLILRNYRHVQQHRATVPAPFHDKISLAEHHKAADYTHAKLRLGSIELLFSAVLFLIWTIGGGLEWLDQLLRANIETPLLLGTCVIIGFSIIGSIIQLPFSLYRTFVLEQRFGFNQTTAATFVGDMLKQLLLSLLIGIPFLLLVLYMMQVSGTLWWIYVWCAWFGLSMLMMWAFPRWIAPLFNKFNPLPEGELKNRILSLLQRCQFQSNGIFIMDGSKRSRHGNAYFTGIGNQKRIVFFDTLLQDLTTDQIEAVLAHELGHFRLKHVPKRLIQMALMSLAGLALLGWLANSAWFYQQLGVTTPSDHMALLLFMLTMPLLSLFIQPISAAGMRKHEFEADAYAASHSNANHLIDALVTLYKENANTLTPDPLYSAFHDSHPPAPVRIAHLQQLQTS